jgi:Fe2+ transport system protein B
MTYSDDIEEQIKKIEPKVFELVGNQLSARWVSLRLLDGDEKLLNEINQRFGYKEEGA